MADRALLIGINDYAQISDLRGCENDAANMARLLTETHGYAPENIRQLLSQDATKSNVLDGFDWLLNGAVSGDRLVLHIAGHGSYIESVNDDEEIDELVCLYNMNIDDPDSYLLDDDLGHFTRRIPDGVRLTVVLDTCHSGTGTRKAGLGRRSPQSALLIIADTARRMPDISDSDAEKKLTRGDSSLFQDLDHDPAKVVMARVYERPHLKKRLRSSPMRRFGASLGAGTRSGLLNHQLLAAADATQTAADAYIDGAYCGAFTYHLCKAARDLGANAEVIQVMNSAKAAILDDGFSQTPQNEGPFSGEPLFGPQSAPSPKQKKKVSGTPNQDRPAEITTASGEELLSQMLRVAEKFIDLADRLVGSEPGRTALAPHITRAGNEFVVYVHGISRHPENYSLPWFQAMDPHLDRQIERREVLWSPVVNPSASRAAPRALSDDERAFAQSMQMIMDDRERQLLATISEADRSRTLSQTRSERGGGLSVDDFARYMLNRAEREEILSIFDQGVRPLLEAGATVHVISHSWGTVVAWEGLRRLDAQSLPGRVANLFVVGSALSVGLVQSNLFGRITDGRRPQHVDQVFNLDARGDVVGGLIGDVFTVTEEFLNLTATGCPTFFPGITCSHGSYFNPENLAVNQDIFARFING